MPSSDAQLFDPSRLEAILEGAGYDSAKLILESFWTTGAELITTMQDACASGMNDDMARAAHSLRGCAANIGADRVSEMTQILETLNLQSEKQTAEVTLEAIKNAFEQTKKTTAAFISSTA
ncbi:MAG: Hpt domain-containing protein [Pseudomonadota bacterium]